MRMCCLPSAVGKPIRVDIRTLEASRGKFARVCVEIKLTSTNRLWAGSSFVSIGLTLSTIRRFAFTLQ